MPLAVAIQGELGSNSELAVRAYFAGSGTAIDILPCRTFDEVFEAVHAGRAGAAMAPLENSLAGSIHDVWRLLVEYRLPVCGELRLRIVHCLIGLPGVRLAQIRRVRSHPQALAQCCGFLHRLSQVETEAVYDTAGAVQMLKAAGDRQAAAIASPQAAADHDMEIIARDLSSRDNFTRFLMLGNTAGDGASPRAVRAGALKTTLVLQLDRAAAALDAVLAPLGKRGLELLKVETHKRAGLPWAYDLYLEFAGDAGDGTTRAAIEEMRPHADALHLIGSYPAGPTLDPHLQRR